MRRRRHIATHIKRTSSKKTKGPPNKAPGSRKERAGKTMREEIRRKIERAQNITPEFVRSGDGKGGAKAMKAEPPSGLSAVEGGDASG